MGYAQGNELHGDRIIDNTPPTVQAAYNDSQYLQAKVVLEVAKELEKARSVHAPMNSGHEGYAVIKEELDELWQEVKRNTYGLEANTTQRKKAMRKEALQVAAMAVRFIEDVCDK